MINIFKARKPIVAMIHLQYKNDLNRLLDDTLKDIEGFKNGGVDGFLFENWGEEYSGRQVSKKTKEYMVYVIEEAAKTTTLPYGINVLPLDFEAAFDIAKHIDVSFIQIDTFVDKVKTDYENGFIINIKPKEVADYRRKTDLDDVALFTNIQTKHYKTIPSSKKIETSAKQAVQNGADALVVTGERTGMETPIDKIIRVKTVSRGVPVWIGSGLDINNVEKLLPYADGAIVGSGLKYDGITENPADEIRVKKFMKAVYKMR